MAVSLGGGCGATVVGGPGEIKGVVRDRLGLPEGGGQGIGRGAPDGCQGLES